MGERIECRDASDLPRESFFCEANVFFDGCARFWDYPLHITLCLRSNRFGTKLMNSRFGMGWHLCRVSDKMQFGEYCKTPNSPRAQARITDQKQTPRLKVHHGAFVGGPPPEPPNSSE